MGFLDSLFRTGEVNRPGGENKDETKEGIAGERLPELELDMKNEELSKLTKSWKKKWDESEEKKKWEKSIEEIERYWKGDHYDTPENMGRAMVDNALWEAVETFLPQATRKNPEPMVSLGKKEEQDGKNQDYAKMVQDRLAELADKQKLRLTIKQATRDWTMAMLGVVKMGWDMDENTPQAMVKLAKKLILDPKATVQPPKGYTGAYIGEIRKEPAWRILDQIDNTDEQKGARKVITDLVGDDTGTEIQFIEWWTDRYMCWTLGDHVLLKRKNFYWNYDEEQQPEGLPNVDEYGEETPLEPVEVKGENHFTHPRMPYVFLSVFNLGKQPMDDTGLVAQNLSNQDEINTLNRQIHDNIRKMNGAWIGSLARAGMTQEQFAQLMEAVQNGGGGTIPDGHPREAIEFYSGNPLPSDVFNSLQDKRNRLAGIFGTYGSTPTGIQNEDTVRGKIINRGLDTDRIGGGVTEYLEQFADDIFNWFVQILYVMDEEFVAMRGKPKIEVSVKEGSLLPKDSTTMANQAIELASAGLMSKKDLYKALDYPDAEEKAVNAFLEQAAPDLLYPEDPRIQEYAQRQAGAGQEKKLPSANIKDMPPDAQAQALAMYGIQADPEALAAFDEEQKRKDQERGLEFEMAKRPPVESSESTLDEEGV